MDVLLVDVALKDARITRKRIPGPKTPKQKISRQLGRRTLLELRRASIEGFLGSDTNICSTIPPSKYPFGTPAMTCTQLEITLHFQPTPAADPIYDNAHNFTSKATTKKEKKVRLPPQSLRHIRPEPRSQKLVKLQKDTKQKRHTAKTTAQPRLQDRIRIRR